jgi:hypothetical protein
MVGHTNIILKYANWKVRLAESVKAGYNVGDVILTALRNILKKR